MRHLKYLLLSIILLPISAAYGQFTGAGSTVSKEFATVQYVKDNDGNLDRKDLIVKLKGFIVEQINSETFWFQDSTGKIKVEIDSKVMPGKPFNEKTELIIIGEVDADLLEGVEIEVNRIEFVKPEKIPENKSGK